MQNMWVRKMATSSNFIYIIKSAGGACEINI